MVCKLYAITLFPKKKGAWSKKFCKYESCKAYFVTVNWHKPEECYATIRLKWGRAKGY